MLLRCNSLLFIHYVWNRTVGQKESSIVRVAILLSDNVTHPFSRGHQWRLQRDCPGLSSFLMSSSRISMQHLPLTSILSNEKADPQLNLSSWASEEKESLLRT